MTDVAALQKEIGANAALFDGGVVATAESRDEDDEEDEGQVVDLEAAWPGESEEMMDAIAEEAPSRGSKSRKSSKKQKKNKKSKSSAASSDDDGEGRKASMKKPSRHHRKAAKKAKKKAARQAAKALQDAAADRPGLMRFPSSDTYTVTDSIKQGLERGSFFASQEENELAWAKAAAAMAVTSAPAVPQQQQAESQQQQQEEARQFTTSHRLEDEDISMDLNDLVRWPQSTPTGNATPRDDLHRNSFASSAASRAKSSAGNKTPPTADEQQQQQQQKRAESSPKEDPINAKLAMLQANMPGYSDVDMDKWTMLGLAVNAAEDEAASFQASTITGFTQDDGSITNQLQQFSQQQLLMAYLVSMGMDTKVAMEMSTNFTKYKEDDSAVEGVSTSPRQQQLSLNADNRENSGSVECEADRLAELEQQRHALKIFHHKQAEAAAGRQLPLGVSASNDRAGSSSPGIPPLAGTSPLTLNSPNHSPLAPSRDNINPPSNRPYWQRAERPGAESVAGRAFGAPRQPPMPPVEFISSRNTSTTSAMTGSQENHRHQQQEQQPHLVEAKTVDAYDDLNLDGMDDVVYAESAPLSISHLLKERSVRRLVFIGLVIMIIIIVAVVLLVLRSNGGNGGGPPESGGGGVTSSPTPAPTGMPTYLSDDILTQATKLSDPVAVAATGSPQRKAVGWLSTVDNVDPNGFGASFVQRYAMVVLYFALEGPDWKDSEHWLDPDAHVCDWSPLAENIRCQDDVTRQRIVVEMDNTRNQLGGSIPPEIGLLTGLKKLKLSNNAIGGNLPPGIFGPSIVDLDLSRNQLTGTLPDQLRDATSLESIDMSNNYLMGSLPSGIYSLRQVRTINFASNQMNGTLQLSWDQMEVLNTIHLEKNSFTGRIPILESAPTLDFIHLDFNKLTGPLPLLTGELIGRQHISLSHNQLTGTLPSGFQQNEIIGDLRLRYIDLSYNKITGDVPILVSLLTSVEHIDVSFNNITGQWPDQPAFQTLPNLEFLAASNNQLTGTIPMGMPSSLKHFDLGNNQLSGGIPELFKNGLTNLEIMILSGNNFLEGTIPAEISTLSKLRNFDCQGCSLGGPIPDGLTRLTNLQVLRLDDNGLTGVLPTVMGDLRFLTHVHLRNNAMQGSIPPELGRLTLMRELVLANNSFVGTIPTALGNLKKLEVLDLSNNDFFGPVPQGLCTSYQNLTYSILGCEVECNCCYDFDASCT